MKSISEYQTRYTELNIFELKIHDGYQRTEEINKKHINSMVKNFDPNRLDPLVIGQDPDGKGYWVIDGQHRLAMAKILNDQGKFTSTIWCRLIKNISFIEQARLFDELNKDRLRLSQTSSFKNKRFMGDPIAIEINRIVSKYNFTIGTGGNSVKSISTITKVYNYLRQDEFDRLFLLLRKTWNGDKQSLNHQIISGLGFLIKKVGKLFTDNDFIDKMETVEPQAIILLGRNLSTGNNNLGREHAIAILQFYNKKRSVKKIPESLLYE